MARKLPIKILDKASGNVLNRDAFNQDLKDGILYAYGNFGYL